MAGKGRRKTGNILVNDKGARLVCFSKRRLGLFKKAEELAILTGAQVGAIVFSPAGKLMAFNASSLEALIERFVPEESQSGNDWESRFQRYLKGEGESDWWMRADVQSMGIEEVRRFKNAILSDRKKRPYDVMAGELTSHDVESSFHPQTQDDNLKKKNKKKKLSQEQPINATLPSSSSSVDANVLSDASFFPGGESVDDMDFSCGPLPWYQFPEQQQLLQWWNDEYSMNDNIQCSCPDMQPIRDITPFSSSDESFFSGEPSIDAMDTNLPWNNLPEFQQQQNDAIFMEASLPHTFSEYSMNDNIQCSCPDMQPIRDITPFSSSDESFFSGEPSIDAMDTNLPWNNLPEFQQQQNDANFMEASLPHSFSDLQPSADNQTSFSLGARFFPRKQSGDSMDSPTISLPCNESFEQQQMTDDWLMNVILANDAGHQSSLEQQEVSLDLALTADFFPSVEAMDTSFSALPWYEAFEQQLWADDWQMNATLADDAFQGNQISNEQLEISHDLVPFIDLFS